LRSFNWGRPARPQRDMIELGIELPDRKAEASNVRFLDGRPSRYFYWDDIAGRRLRPDLVDSATAKQAAQSFARAEQNVLDSQS
jgi:hypothetical protein